jgi:hypothetical protein
MKKSIILDYFLLKITFDLQLAQQKQKQTWVNPDDNNTNDVPQNSKMEQRKVYTSNQVLKLQFPSCATTISNITIQAHIHVKVDLRFSQQQQMSILGCHTVTSDEWIPAV